MASVNEFQSRVVQTSVTIASSGTTSTSATLAGTDLIKIVVPTAFTGTAITFQGSYDGGTTWGNVEYDGAVYSITVLGSRSVPSIIALEPAVFVGIPMVRAVSGSAEGGARTLTLVSRPI